MTTLSGFSLYQLGCTSQLSSKKDKVDSMVDEILDINRIVEIKDFISEHFGDVEGTKWFNYPELEKSVYVLNEDKRVEICMLFKNKQYYGKGWVPRA
jgi:hypothetical protein